MGKWRSIAAVVLAVLGLGGALVVPAQAGKTVKKNIKIGDYFFAPEKLTVKSGTYVIWHWPKIAGDQHDVYLKKGPKGVKRFRSEILSADVSYKKKLTVPGKYSIICSLHPDTMKLTITVKK
jgi:plastocyanin